MKVNSCKDDMINLDLTRLEVQELFRGLGVPSGEGQEENEETNKYLYNEFHILVYGYKEK